MDHFWFVRTHLRQAREALAELPCGVKADAPDFAALFEDNIKRHPVVCARSNQLVRVPDAAWLLRKVAAQAARATARDALPESRFKEHLYYAHVGMYEREAQTPPRDSLWPWLEVHNMWWLLWRSGWKKLRGEEPKDLGVWGPMVWWDDELAALKQLIAKQDPPRVVLHECWLWPGLIENVSTAFGLFDEQSEHRLHFVELALARIAALRQMPDYVAAKKPLAEMADGLNGVASSMVPQQDEAFEARSWALFYQLTNEWWELWQQAMGAKETEWP